MHIYKLHYTDNEAAHNDLLAKGIYEVTEDGTSYINGTQAVVFIGKLEDKEKVGITENETPIYQEGVFYDVMTTAEIDFGDAEVFPKEYAHTFAGYPTHPETEEENE
tara:strand:+ start:1601 stop:1921 length:321 start_codon:yes stop_codon:yes gene_type:complete